VSERCETFGLAGSRRGAPATQRANGSDRGSNPSRPVLLPARARFARVDLALTPAL